MGRTKVVATDTETNESEECVIENDYVLVCDGSCHIASVQDYPTKGTRVITIKGRR